MRNFSDIKHRMKSVSDTRKITGAMETISVAKMQKAWRRYENNKAYFSTIRQTIENIVRYTKQAEHKVFSAPKDAHTAIIVIASDKGLAGGFNHAVLAYALQTVQVHADAHIFAVGQVCKEYFDARNRATDVTFADASFDPDIEQAAEIGERLYAMFRNGEIDGAFIVYTAMEGHGKMTPVAERLLPFPQDFSTEKAANGDYVLREIVYEPSAEEVLERLVPQYLTGMIYGALIQSSACEHSQRRSAMHSATRNASALLDELRGEYNRLRQEAVTNELSDIVTAANGVGYDDGK